MSKKKKQFETDMIVDGMEVKKIQTEEGTIFRQKKGLGIHPHIMHNKPEESHLDLTNDGRKICIIREVKPRFAGVAIDLNTKKLHNLPPIIVREDSEAPKSDIERGVDYTRRVKFK